MIKKYNEFINEANLSQEFLKFKKGDAVVITKPISLLDFDFKKSARTWWGQKVASVLNISTKGDEYSKDRKYKPGDVLWIFTEPSTIDSKGRANITGYAGFFQSSFSSDPKLYKNSSYVYNLDYDDVNVQVLILALKEGYAEVVRYEDLPESKRTELEFNIKVEGISNILLNSTIIYGDMEVIAYDKKNRSIILHGFNKRTGEKMPDKLIKSEDVVNGIFIDTNTGKEIG